MSDDDDLGGMTFEPVPPALAEVLSRAVEANRLRDALARVEVELAIAIDAAIEAGHSAEEVRLMSRAWGFDDG